ncbi:hypothetical protein GQ44DRAFT_823623 [Phaeosphaeriaceae sp. PMI808]|nr:hypothetical protein GQ44DRAFT_823623 [Phaeosphaeriaceae sp. PMI808]
MSSGPVTVAEPPGQGVAPLNFIYACAICCHTFADVHEGHNTTVKGLSDGINPKDRLVTRLFLASCCHVFCGSHLDGGGPAFHPNGQRPQASCPVCVKEKGESEPRDLYSIRGFQKDEYDPMIPQAWFTAPPISFDGAVKEMEALRFQYLALVRYCQNSHATRKPLQSALNETEKKLASMKDLASKERDKMVLLQQENKKLKREERISEQMKSELQRLQGIEQEVEQYRRLNVNPRDLETFKNNKEAIRHYLKLVPILIEQNGRMQERLASVGFAMPLDPIPNLQSFDLDAINDDGGMKDSQHGRPTDASRKITSSHTVGRSAQTEGNPMTASASPFTQRPIKRQRVESPHSMQTDLPTSRDVMPPPEKPLSRMRSVRKLFPTLRKKFSFSHQTRIPEVSHGDNGNLDANETEQQGGGAPGSSNDNGVSSHHNYCSQPPYMSGALPVEHPSHVSDSQGSQLLSSVGVDNNTSEFTFRAESPVKMSHQGSSRQTSQLPTEPSYIRLMDGLSRDHGVELELKDPRQISPSYDHGAGGFRQVNQYEESSRNREEVADQKLWNLSPFSPDGGQADSIRVHRADSYYDRHLQDPPLGPVTPVPRRHQQSTHQPESVFNSFRTLSVSKSHSRTGAKLA